MVSMFSWALSMIDWQLFSPWNGKKMHVLMMPAWAGQSQSATHRKLKRRSTYQAKVISSSCHHDQI